MIAATLLALATTETAADDAAMSGSYRRPPEPIARFLTAPRPPQPVVHAEAGRVALLTREAVVPIARLARPFIGLAGFRYEPVTGTSNRDPLVGKVEVITLRPTGSPERVEWRPGGDTVLDDVDFSPDGRFLAALGIGDGPARMRIFDIARAEERILDAPVNAAWGSPCVWAWPADLLCRLVPADRGPAPDVAPGPRVLEHGTAPLPTRTYSNLLENDRDEALFEYHFTSELARITPDGRVTRLPATRGLVQRIVPSPDGQLAILTRLARPFSHLVPASRFPHTDEMWDVVRGTRLHELRRAVQGDGADAVAAHVTYRWKPSSAPTVGWVERATDDHGARVFRWMTFELGGTSREELRSAAPIDRFGWTTAGTPFVVTTTEHGTRAQAHRVVGGRLHEFWSGATEDRYGNPGRALRTYGSDGRVMEIDGRIFLAGDGLGPGGARPFLDAVDPRTLESERLFTADEGLYEHVVGIVSADPLTVVTARESETEPPAFFALADGRRTLLHATPDPFPQLADVERRLVTYERKDGVALQATLYLPAGRKADTPLPTLVWIYPYEFSEPDFAEQSEARRFRFHQVKGPSPLIAPLAGYALVLNPTMPIIGEPGTANDEYLAQLVANAEAAVAHVVDAGIADPKRIAIAGRSYGAFSAANLLVHSRLFRTAIAMSGAYNRTLTPFGFQREYRSFWDATALYAEISPFFRADRISGPMLVVHGAADENAGTPPAQARRFVHALIGNGSPVRYVEMPYEGHHYWGRESVLHVAAELLDWLERTLR